MHLISHGAVYDSVKISEAFIDLIERDGILSVRENLQSTLVLLNGMQVQEFKPDVQTQIDLLKSIDAAIKKARVD